MFECDWVFSLDVLMFYIVSYTNEQAFYVILKFMVSIFIWNVRPHIWHMMIKKPCCLETRGSNSNVWIVMVFCTIDPPSQFSHFWLRMLSSWTSRNMSEYSRLFISASAFRLVFFVVLYYVLYCVPLDILQILQMHFSYKTFCFIAFPGTHSWCSRFLNIKYLFIHLSVFTELFLCGSNYAFYCLHSVCTICSVLYVFTLSY